MIPKLEFGQLYKFVVSVGFVLIAAALLAPWAILRDQGALTISQGSLEELTPRARQVLESKQQHAEWIVAWYPWASLVLLLGGVALAAWGLVRWWRRQQVADEREDVDLRVQRLTLEPATPAEKEHRLDVEVDEALGTSEAVETLREETSAPNVPETISESAGPPASAGVGTATSSERSPKPAARHAEWIALREYVQRIEQLAAFRISDALRDTHRVETGVKVRIGRDTESYADIVALASLNSLAWSFVIDVKHIRAAAQNIGNRLGDSLVNGAAVARGLRRHRVAALTLFVLESGVDDDRARRQLKRALQRVRGAFSVPVGAVLVSEKDLDSMSADDLRQLLAQAAIESLDPFDGR